MAPAEWPDWEKLEGFVKREDFGAGGTVFQELRKKVIQSEADDLEEVASHASIAWEFLIGFAAKKASHRRQVLSVVQKFSEAPAWMAAWEAHTELHAKVKDLHEDLQASLAVQSEAIAQKVTPAARKSMVAVKREDMPAFLRKSIVADKHILEIRNHQPEAQFGAADDEAVPAGRSSISSISSADVQKSAVSVLQAGIDAAVAIDDDAKMDNGGLAVLNDLRIGCIQCAGDEAILSNEASQATLVFNFLLHLLRRKPDEVAAAAEVMNQLMASPSWAAVFEGSAPLQESIRELREDTQAALGLQHEKLLRFISPAARSRAERGDLAESVKDIAALMKSIRPEPEAATDAASAGYAATPAAPLTEAAPAPVAPTEEWRAARTPQGHTYYFNVATKESQWERPASLGGPIVFSAGADVEVWSNSQNCWGKGKVEKVEGGKVVCDFSLPNGQSAKKELPAGHKDLRLAVAGTPTESLSPEEEELYRRLFNELPGGDEKKKSAKAIADLLYKTGAKVQTLRQVWAVANPGLSQEIEFEDFARCCRLVAHCQVMGLDSDMVAAGERPLRVALRTACLFTRPEQLPKFDA